MLNEINEERESRIEAKERIKADSKMIKILIDNVILAVKLNISINSIQEINHHMAKYITIPESWRSKNYAFEFIECINHVIHQQLLKEIINSNFHCLIIDESTDISVHKVLILYIKYRVELTYKTVFLVFLNYLAVMLNQLLQLLRQFTSIQI